MTRAALHSSWLAVCALACSADSSVGALVVGVTSDYAAGSELTRLDVEMSVQGSSIAQQQLGLGVSAGLTSFPLELAFEDVSIGSRLAMTLRGMGPGESLAVVRHMETDVASSERRLVRIHLERECRLDPAPGGPAPAPTCNESTETCIGGACLAATVGAAEQIPYTPDWAGGADACKPGGGAPEVVVGAGQSDYLPTADYDLAQIEAGPQGGHHVWVAARVRNLHRSGSITEVGGEIPALGLSITALRVVFTMDQDEGGWCKLHGLRFQLDIDGNDVMTMLGQELKVVVTITDRDGDVAMGERWLTLSGNII